MLRDEFEFPQSRDRRKRKRHATFLAVLAHRRLADETSKWAAAIDQRVQRANGERAVATRRSRGGDFLIPVACQPASLPAWAGAGRFRFSDVCTLRCKRGPNGCICPAMGLQLPRRVPAKHCWVPRLVPSEEAVSYFFMHRFSRLNAPAVRSGKCWDGMVS